LKIDENCPFIVDLPMKNGDLTPLKSPKNRPRRHEVALRRGNFGAGRWTAGAGARAGPGGDRSGKKNLQEIQYP
jgi:hypothetical protein